MKYTSKLILFFLAFSSIIRLVSARQNCTEGYLKKLGMIYESDDVTKPKVFLMSQLLMHVGSKLALKPRASAQQYFELLKLGLTQVELDDDEDNCVRCFSDSVQCVVKHCKSHCIANPCRKACIKCIESKCKQRLLECIDQEDIVNACQWEDEYLKFKSPLDKIFPADKDGASGSGASA